MEPIRVLIADGSTSNRLILRRQLADAVDVSVVATASSGRQVLRQLEACDPQVVILDVDMSEMDGLATLAALRKTRGTLPVIMFSSRLQRGARETVDARLLGANDCLLKPEDPETLAHCIEHELLPRIRSFGRAESAPPKPEASAEAKPAKPSRVARTRPPFGVIVIASSTGGPIALERLLVGLPRPLSVPILIVQHMPEGFTESLAERLAAKTGLAVREAEDLAPLTAAQIWVARGDHHLFVQRARNDFRLRLNQEAAENECRPAADVLFRSVAELFGPRALAVVLTGMGNDGLKGSRRIRETGGQVLVQDQASSAVWGMPGQIANAGLANAVLPLDQLSREIAHRMTPPPQ